MEGGTNNVQQGVKRVSNFDGKKANDVLELSPKIRRSFILQYVNCHHRMRIAAAVRTRQRSDDHSRGLG